MTVKPPDTAVLFCATPEEAQFSRQSLGITSPVVHGECAQCQKKILWSPTAPKDIMKVCAECGFKLAGTDDVTKLDLNIMPSQRRELEDLLTTVNPLNPVAIWVQGLLDKTKGNC